MDALTQEKLDLLKVAIKKVVKAVEDIQHELNQIEYDIQQKDFKELEEMLEKNNIPQECLLQAVCYSAIQGGKIND